MGVEQGHIPMMSVDLLSITPDAERVIELAGRTAYQSFQNISETSADAFIKMILDKGHESVLEHAVATFRIGGVSRAMTHQLVRHRLVSYTQKSQRYVDEQEFKYVTPPSIENSLAGYKGEYDLIMRRIRSAYETLVEIGFSKEDARFVLPNATETEIVVTANFRQWRHMIALRTSKHAQWEIRAVFKDILSILKRECPSVFSDFE